MQTIIGMENLYGAHNYAPLPVVLTKGEGVYLWDNNGRKYLDMMSAYSAVSHGHCHPRVVGELVRQAQMLCVTSRAYYTDKLAPFLAYLCKLTGQDKALLMNTGAEAVETAIKAARKWGYTVKGIPPKQAEIIVCDGNFHGRTTGIISFSSEAQYQSGFEPLMPGFRSIPYGNTLALESAINANTAAFLVEPIQGEAGIRVPPAGYLKRCAEICALYKVLFICDEVQTGLGRTGEILAVNHEGVKPDAITLGKALGGGVLPVSAFLAKDELMDVFTPGDHGSTFGGNPLAAAVGLVSLQTMVAEDFAGCSAELGRYFLAALSDIQSPLIRAVRGKGLFVGMEVDTRYVTARDICLQLMTDGLLTKDTHGTVVRFCPPLVITRAQLQDSINIIKHALKTIEKRLG